MFASSRLLTKCRHGCIPSDKQKEIRKIKLEAYILYAYCDTQTQPPS